MSRTDPNRMTEPARSNRRGMLKQTAGAAVLGMTAWAASLRRRIHHPRSAP